MFHRKRIEALEYEVWCLKNPFIHKIGDKVRTRRLFLETKDPFFEYYDGVIVGHRYVTPYKDKNYHYKHYDVYVESIKDTITVMESEIVIPETANSL